MAPFHTQSKRFWDLLRCWVLGQFKWEKLCFQGIQLFHRPTARPNIVRNQSTLRKQYGFSLHSYSSWHSWFNTLMTLKSRITVRPLGDKGKQAAIQERRTDIHKDSKSVKCHKSSMNNMLHKVRQTRDHFCLAKERRKDTGKMNSGGVCFRARTLKGESPPYE